MLGAITVVLISPTQFLAQSPQPGAAVPHLINISGTFRPADGQPPAAVEAVTLSIYAEQEGGTPLWQETQSVALDDAGRYALLLGATSAAGVPPDVFANGEAQWLGIVFARPGEVDGPRLRITSVPYALRSADADTLGGRPASAYLLAPSGAAATGETAAAGETSDPVAPAAVNPGTPNFLAKYVNGTDVGNSAVYEIGGAVGIGTTSPLDTMHVRFTNTNGGFTGYAVQNLGSTASSYSGTLFYDQNGALGQFQGFNNVTHEYRINNIASTSGVFNGSINFMTGSTSRFFVATGGNIGIGTTSPVASLDVTNALSTNPSTFIIGTSYTNSAAGSTFVGRKARGTAVAPSAVLNNDLLSFFGAAGYGATAFSGTRGGILVRAAENWTDTAQGTFMNFNTTSVGTITPVTKMSIDSSGNVGIGTFPFNDALEVVRIGNARATVMSFGSGEPRVLTRFVGGTPATPAATQVGDVLGVFGGGGYGATSFTSATAAMAFFAAENWTDSAQGSALVLATTPLGSNVAAITMGLLANGNVGIGTPPGPGGEPTALDRLQVFGDVRVGTTGTNGCVKRFDGTGLVGTCSSDARFKRDITPFGRVLGPVTALRPVHYYWRAAEFPDQHFGDSRTYGLIAQEVEAVLPELVVTGADGFKAVDYSKLPLLTIQAVKELKTENDALKLKNDELETRLKELERLVNELLTATRR
jgi:hypothetical protein